MTFCPDCEEWVEVDEGKCLWCDSKLNKKKKKVGVDDDGDENEIVTLSDDDDFPFREGMTREEDKKERKEDYAVSDSEG